MPMTHEALLEFWFADATSTPRKARERERFWFRATPQDDAEIRTRFLDLADQAAAGTLKAWEATSRSCLALIIALDQLPRNLYRGTADAFANDGRARDIVDRAPLRDFLPQLAVPEQVFFLMPLQHAEDLSSQEALLQRCKELIAAGPVAWREYLDQFERSARRHHEIIERFGRFPHRNLILGRDSTAEELAFLDSGSGSFGQPPRK